MGSTVTNEITVLEWYRLYEENVRVTTARRAGSRVGISPEPGVLPIRAFVPSSACASGEGCSTGDRYFERDGVP